MPRPLPSPPSSPDSHPTRRAGNSSSDSADPFLALGADIPLTRRDRQEGYDLDLVHAQPRGGPPRPSTSSNRPSRSERTHRPGKSTGSAVGAAAVGGAGAAAVTAATIGSKEKGLGDAASKEYDPREVSSAGTEGQAWAEDARRPRRPWYMRPWALLALIALVVVIALAVGLGVGLSRRNRSEGPYGTVIPSSLGELSTTRGASRTLTSIPPNSAPTTPPPSSASSLDSNTGILTPAISGESASPGGTATVVTTLTGNDPAAFSSLATSATSGNRPVPAGSATTIGTTVYESVAVDTPTSRNPATVTNPLSR